MNTCIYCLSHGTFTSAEHVFPFALGGGGDGWTLHDCVCDKCNNMFSRLERELARSSFDAVSRTAFGPEGRRKRGSRKVPLFASEIYYLDQKDDIVYEGGVSLGFEPYIRPQIIEKNHPILCLTGGTDGELKTLVKAISNFINNDFFITTHSPTQSSEDGKFNIFFLSVDSEGKIFIIEERKNNKPLGIWYEEFYGEIDGRRKTPRVYIDDEKRLVVRAQTIDEALNFLGFLILFFKSGVDFNKEFDDKTITTELDPKFVIHLSIRYILVARAVAKIGMNFVISLFGNDFARRDSFDGIKAFIRGELNNGDPEYLKHFRWIENQSVFDIIGATSSDKHWMFVFQSEDILLFGIRFYGGKGGYLVKLGQIRAPISNALGIEFIEVDYISRETKVLSVKEVIDLYTSNENRD